MKEVIVNVNNFKSEVLKSEIPVLVDFWATWCGPCRMLAPTVSEIAEKYDGKVKVCKVDIDENIPLAEKYRIEVIPTLVVFDGGKEKTRNMGLMTAAEIEKML
ncbi:MAG: thioredoxin [Clostridia bacterium]|nr:thioredoxin [Clostridia bacterium]